MGQHHAVLFLQFTAEYSALFKTLVLNGTGV
jgi:hypothetical protein